MPIHLAQQRVDTDERANLRAGRQIGAIGQRDQMFTHRRFQPLGVTEGELPQQSSFCRRCVHIVEQGLRKAGLRQGLAQCSTAAVARTLGVRTLPLEQLRFRVH